MSMKQIGNWIRNFFIKVGSEIVKITRALRDALTVGDAARNLGITNQTVTTVASAAVPIVLPPGTVESAGVATKTAVVSALSWLSNHGLTAAGWITFKVSVVPSFVVGSAIATFGISILLLGGIALLQHGDPRVSIFSRFVEDARAGIAWLKSIFSF
jgi:hypothetical protein